MAKTALITGASSGLGRGFALALARRDYHLFLTGRNQSRLEAVAREISNLSSSRIFRADLSDPSACSRLIDSVLAENGAPDLLVNNAASMPSGDFVQRSEAEIEATFFLNLIAPAELTRRFCTASSPTLGVIFVLSAAARFPQPYNSLYSASKVGLRFLAESLHVEFAGRTRICLAYPPLTATPMTDRIRMGRQLVRKADAVQVAERIIAAFESGRDEITWIDWEIIPSFLYRLTPGLFRYLLKSQRQTVRRIFE